MIRKFEHNGHEYWVTVEPAIHEVTKETFFIAYVNDKEPGGLLYGLLVRNEKGEVMTFANELSALTNANNIKQGYIDRTV